MYLDKSLKEYNEILSDESTYPISESSLALTGALAASLLLAYFKNLYKEKKDEEKLELKKTIERMFNIKEELMDVVDEAYRIIRAKSKPKETVTKETVVMPILIAQKCNNILELISEVDDNIGLNIINSKYSTALFAGVYKTKASLMGSLACVKINLEDLERGELYSFALEERQKLLKAGEKNFENILESIEEKILEE